MKPLVRILLGIIFFALVAGLLAGAAVWIYNAGLSQGLVQSGKLAVPAVGQGMLIAPYYAHPWGFFPFFGWIPMVFLFIFFLFIIPRLIFWGRMGGRHWGGRWNHDPESIPTRVEEWHRQMHEKMGDQPQPKN